MTRRLMALLLLAFLAVHGHAGVVRQWLGANHQHHGGRPVTQGLAVTAALPATRVMHPQVDDWLTTLRAWRQDHHAHAHAHAHAHVHDHRHGAIERHHHAIGDASVVALDDGGAAGHRGAEGSAAAPAVGVEWPPGLAGASGPVAAAAAAATSAWPRSQARTWQSAVARLVERPPQA